MFIINWLLFVVSEGITHFICVSEEQEKEEKGTFTIAPCIGLFLFCATNMISILTLKYVITFIGEGSCN